MKTVPLIVSVLLSCPGEVWSAPPSGTPATAKPKLRFLAYDGSEKTDPKDMSFQVNTPDIRQPTNFLKLGETVSGTKFKLTKFEFKTTPAPNGEKKDISELTLVNVETKETVLLVLGAR